MSRIRQIIGAAIACGLAACSGEPASEKVPENPEVLLATDRGDIVIEVYVDRAPVSAGNFMRYVEEGRYQPGEFYRVIRPDNDQGTPAINAVQGGLPEGEEPLAPVTHETTDVTGILHEDGVVSLARADPGTASSEFFISIGDNPSLDHGGMRNPDALGFAAFGRVIAGMDIVREIQQMRDTAPSDEPYFEGQILSDPVQFTASVMDAEEE